MLKKAHLFFILLTNTVIYGQINSFYPDVARSYKSQQAWLNPSNIDTAHYHLNMLASNVAGNRGNVGLYQAHAGLTLNSAEKRYQTFRVFFSNEKEGPYISKPRGYLNYGIRLKISQKSFLSSGISYGFSSASINASLVSNSNNFFTHDASLGLTFSKTNWSLGASLFHALNNKISDKINSQYLKRYYHINGYYNIPLDFRKHIEISGFYRLFSDLKNQYLANLIFYPRDEFGFGTGYYNQRGISFYIYFQQILTKNEYNIFFTYNSGWGSQVPTLIRSVEIGLKINFHKN